MLVSKIKVRGLKLMIKYIHGDKILRNYVSEEQDEISEELISSFRAQNQLFVACVVLTLDQVLVLYY